MEHLAAEYFRANPDLQFAALGPQDNARALELRPYGVKTLWLPAEAHPEVAEAYLLLNHRAFPRLPLARWVLSDLYLLPGVVGLLLGPPGCLDPGFGGARPIAAADGRVILAAYVGAPSVHRGTFIGVSLLSFAHGLQAGAWVKVLTARLLQAERIRGVVQWDNLSMRVHTRLGPLRVVGPVPGGHELSARSLVYESELTDEAVVALAMKRQLRLAGVTPLRMEGPHAHAALLARAGHYIAPPGLDEHSRVLLTDRVEPIAPAAEPNPRQVPQLG
jgi:hypothetical protein